MSECTLIAIATNGSEVARLPASIDGDGIVSVDFSLLPKNQALRFKLVSENAGFGPFTLSPAPVERIERLQIGEPE